jgi:hypothetical protein
MSFSPSRRPAVAEVPTEVLTEHFEKLMSGRRLVTAVFNTFEFEPAFFELEILPAFFDCAMSHVNQVRLLQLEDSLRELGARIAVFYDANRLIAGDAGSRRLDLDCVPVRLPRGVFHPKLVLLLVETPAADADTPATRSLLVGCMSANLTRTGWWSNVECAHVEEIAAGAATRMREPLLAHLRFLEGRMRAGRTCEAVALIKRFVQSTEQQTNRSVAGGLRPHLHCGFKRPIVEFLDDTAGASLRGLHLEVVSSSFDAAGVAPLKRLVERFAPRSVRVALPVDHNGAVKVSQATFDDLCAIEGAEWASLPSALLNSGKAAEARRRHVHAKVYRFYSGSPKREILFIGSANLTSAAHDGGANLEAGLLVEIDPPRRPEAWLTPLAREPKEFAAAGEDEDSVRMDGSPLVLEYDWTGGHCHAYWDSSAGSSKLELRSGGVRVADIAPLPPRIWSRLPADAAEAICECLRSSSIFTVVDDTGIERLLLAQEVGMERKPSLLAALTPADILRYWALLSADERAIFLETHAGMLAKAGLGEDLVAEFRDDVRHETLFDRFAGIFLAFDALERFVRDAIASGRVSAASTRIFGAKHDSLGKLLDGLAKEGAETADPVRQYLIVLCARQLVQQLQQLEPEFWSSRSSDARELKARIEAANARQRLETKDGIPDAEMRAFLDWFEPIFVKRARREEPVE